MKFRLLALVVILLTLGGGAQSRVITLKNSFFEGWKYSVNDGGSYRKIGVSATGLYAAMEGNEEAQNQLKSYKSFALMSVIAGYPGGALIGWPLGALAGGEEWTDGYKTMIYVGVSLGVVSFLFETKANSHLKKSVKIYNGEKQAVIISPGLKYSTHNSNPVLQFTLNVTF